MIERDQDLPISTGAYVLHALDAEEAARLEERAAQSEALRAEIVELSDTAVELGLSVPPEAPPAELRTELLARIASAPQLSAPHSAPVTRIAVARRVRRVPRPVAVLVPVAAAAAIITAIGVGVLLPDTPASRIAAVQSASDVRSTTVNVHGGGTLRVSWSDQLDSVAVRADRLPRLSDGQVYELWFIAGDSARPAGTFDGSGALPLDGKLVRGDRIGMTIESAGGSASPTTAPIALVRT